MTLFEKAAAASLMFLWFSSSIFFVYWYTHSYGFMKVLWGAGCVLSNACGLCLVLYTSNIERRLRNAEASIKANSERHGFWK